MLPSLLLLPLTGGFLVLLAQNRRPPPRLIETLAPPHVAALSVQDKALAMPAMMTVDQNLALSVGLLGMTAVGHWGVPLLRLLSAPGLLYLDLYFIRNAYVEWQAEHQIGIAVSDAVLATGLLVTRQFGAGSLFATLFFTSRKLQAQAEKKLARYSHSPATHKEESSDQAPLVVASAKPAWQSWIDQGALPLLVLSAISTPWLGLKRSLAVLLTNFGYDYRLTAPLSTLSYLQAAGTQGIWLRDGQTLDQLQQVDVLVLDVDWNDQEIAALQADTGRRIIRLRAQADAPDGASLMAGLHAEGRIVAYFSLKLRATDAPAADVRITVAHEPPTMALPVHVLLSNGQPAQLQELFRMTSSLAATQKRGLYFALAPGLLNLGGIYLGRFGVITALLVDYGGSTVGILNAMWPRLQFTTNQEGVQDGAE